VNQCYRQGFFVSSNVVENCIVTRIFRLSLDVHGVADRPFSRQSVGRQLDLNIYIRNEMEE